MSQSQSTVQSAIVIPGKVPPGPRGVPWFGSLFSMFRDPLRWGLDMGQAYGPVSYSRIGHGALYMFNDPELIESALVGKHRECIKDRWTRDLSSLLGNGLLTSDGDRWRHHRRLAAPPLQPKRIASYAESMLASTERFLSGLGAGGVRNVHADMGALTLEIAARTLLGFDARGDADRVAAILDTTMTYFDGQFYSWRGLLPRWVPTPIAARYRAAVAELDRMLYAVVRRCRTEAEPADHLLARLLQARGEHGEALSDVEVRDEAVTMLLAGHETTALTLSYACHLLAAHPQIAAQLRDEVDGVFGKAPVTLAELPRLRLLDGVLRETLRLYPPAFIIGREVIESFELGGYTIPRRAEILLCPYSVHRDARFYTEPLRFDPERWARPETQGLHRFTYFPFGGGPRICIGNHFAMLEAAIVLATLVQRFELKAVPGFQLRLRPAITLRPAKGGIPVDFVRR